MKKRILVVLLVILALSTLMLVSCKRHTCDYSTLKETKTEATCTEAGVGVYECECGETTEKAIPAKGHTTEKQTVAATCKDNGYTIDVCTVCGDESNKVVTDAAGEAYHKFDKMVQEAADCKTGKKGRDARVCSICDKEDPSYPNRVINPAHEWDEENPEVVEPTCTEDGSSTIKCKNCGQVKGSTTLPSPGHNWENVAGTEVEANCDHGTIVTQQCSVCKETQETEADDKREHDIQNGVDPATCTTAALNYVYCGHEGCDFKEYTGATGEPLGHDITDCEYVIVPETCTTPGSKTPICKRVDCGKVLTEEEMNELNYDPTIAPCAHYTVSLNAPAGSVGYKITGTVPESCHNNKYDIYVCTSDPACQETKNVEYAGTKLPHELVLITEVYPEAQSHFDATCLSIGYDLYICKNCNDKGNEHECEGDGTTACYEHRQTDPIAPHKISNVLTDRFVDSTCKKAATVDYTCVDCGGTYEYVYPTEGDAAQVGDYTIVALKEHGDWAATNEVVEATCTTHGYKKYECTRDDDCTESIEGEIKRNAEHTFTKYDDGRFVCAVCKVTYRDITTIQDEPIDSGNFVVDENTTFQYEVIGYENPKAPEDIESGTAYDKTEFEMSVLGGLIVLETTTDEKITYTITIVDEADNESVYTIEAIVDSGAYSYTITDADNNVTTYKSRETGKTVYFDLYSEESIKSINIEASADATVRLFANEG